MRSFPHSTTRLGFINVLDAFHVINQEEIPVRLFHKDFKRGSKRLILTDKTIELARSLESSSVAQETESRLEPHRDRVGARHEREHALG